MAMGRRKEERQESLFVVADGLRAPRHVFYERLNRILLQQGFDAFVEDLCRPFYAEKQGRPGLAPGVYFRTLFIGYFEGIDSERGMAWRIEDSLSLRAFLGFTLADSPPDHSTLSRTRRLIDVETHDAVFGWMLKVLSEEGLIDGRTVGVDGTLLEANAALRSIVRKDSGESYTEFLTELAQASGIETPTRADLAKIDRKRPKKGSNDDWEHPGDPTAKIMKMKDGLTHLAHKAEHVVDLGEDGHGAILAVVRHDANLGDTNTILESVGAATRHLHSARNDPDASTDNSPSTIQEVVTDKGYHSNDVLKDFEELEVRTYCSEPDRGRRNWQGQNGPENQVAVYANRRRVRGERGKRLLARRGEFLERTFAHCYETGAMRRLHVRGDANITKRLLLQAAAFNLSLVMRKRFKAGTPRGYADLVAALCRAMALSWTAIRTSGTMLLGRIDRIERIRPIALPA
jgi:transposase